jgi:hypothetical protein
MLPGERDLRDAVPGLTTPDLPPKSAAGQGIIVLSDDDVGQSQRTELQDSEKRIVADLVNVLLSDRLMGDMLEEMKARGHVALDRARISSLLLTAFQALNPPASSAAPK